MKKKFVIALAVCAAAACPNLSYAEPHVVHKNGDLEFTVGAELDVQAASRIQSSKYRKVWLNSDNKPYDSTKPTTPGAVTTLGITANNKDVAFTTAAAAFLGFKNKSETGITYGAHVGLTANTRGGYLPAKDNTGRTYGYVEHDSWGKIEIGTKKGVSTSMAIDADDIAAATGGIGGGWGGYLSLNTYQGPNFQTQAMNDNNFLDGPKSMYKDSDTKSNFEGNRKINYYTPKFSNGIQIGVSYIPDSRNKSDSNTTALGYQSFPNASGATRRLKNLIAAVIKWTHQINDKQSIELEVDGETGQLTSSIGDRLAGRHYYSHQRAYHAGAQYTYDKAKFVLSYGNVGKYKWMKNPAGVKDGQFWTGGASYKFTDKLSASFTYFHSWNRNTLDSYSIGTEYKWLPGIKPYAEVTYVKAVQRFNYADYKFNDPTKPVAAGKSPNYKNSGTVLIIGAMVTL